MSTISQTEVDVQIIDNDVPIAAKLAVVTGWRPSLVIVSGQESGSLLFMQVDEWEVDGSNPDTSWAIGGAGGAQANAIEIKDYGYTLGSNANFRDADRRLACVAFRGTGSVPVTEYSKITRTLSETEAFGSGKQFTASQDRDTGALTWPVELAEPGVYKWSA